MTFVKPFDDGALFKAADNTPRAALRRQLRDLDAAARLDFGKLHGRFCAALAPERRDELAAGLGVRSDALEAIGAGWATAVDLREMHASGAGWSEDPPDGAFVFPERDGSGKIVGFSMRALDGRKGAPAGSVGARRGLIVPATLHQRPGPILAVEGASDVASCVTLGLAAVGRPSNTGGARDLAALLDGHDVLIIGENDAKADGSWPGRDGAKKIAGALAGERGEPIKWTLPPKHAKDVRGWLQERVAAGLDLADQAACVAAGRELLQTLNSAARTMKPGRPPKQAEMLVRIALELYRVGMSDTEEPFAVARAGPNIALMFRGSRDALRSALAREYRRRYGVTPGASALADALVGLTGEAHEATPEPVYLRLAAHGDNIIIDIGDAGGRAVVIRPGAWEVVDASPVLFRRTALTGTLPTPERGGDISELRRLLNVTDDSWPLLLGWSVAAMMPGIPHPILMLGGEQGTGKSTAARLLGGLIDPSPAPLRSQPADMETWCLMAAGSWLACIDNVSGVAPWWSDSLCKACTGDGFVHRRFYTNGELFVAAFRRVIVLTSIDAGALRGDLGDRLILADLERIDERHRRTETDLDAQYNAMRPRLFGALLDTVARVLARLPDVELATLPRMADFARQLAALDGVLPGLDSLPRYLAQAAQIADDLIEADSVGQAIVKMIGDGVRWSGTAGELLRALTPDGRAPHGWPISPRGLVGRVKRLMPALRAAGVATTFWRAGHSRARLMAFESVGEHPFTSAASAAYPTGATENAVLPPAPADGCGRLRTVGQEQPSADRPHKNGPGATENAVADGADGADGRSGALSNACPDDDRPPLDVLANSPEACGGTNEWGDL